jgi:Zn-dependent metalloprotease
MQCGCTIIPADVLEKLSHDKKLSTDERKSFADTAQFDSNWRKVRALRTKTTASAQSLLASGVALAAAPAVTVFDCKKTTSLPGTPVASPGTAADATAKRAFVETTEVAKFYKAVFGRNSIDNMGMTLQSSIHYGVKYNNAFWTGGQMVYGDGDGQIFVDFTKSNDVIGHELTHGVTQHSSQFAYSNEAGGLNESMSDVFGSMFRQWRAGQTAAQGDWLIGKDIMGPAALARGLTCLRDMASPGAAHCLAPQPTHYSQLTPGMDPHYTSGPPNLAFCKAAKAAGGKSWEKVGKVWYRALTGYRPSPNMKMKTFAARTRKLAKSMFPGDTVLAQAIDKGWKAVGL